MRASRFQMDEHPISSLFLEGGNTMAKVKKTLFIQAPVREVFEFMDTPEKLVEIWPSLVEVSNVQSQPGGGNNFHWKYKMAGMFFEGDTTVQEFVRDQRTVTSNSGGIPSTFVWTYQPEDNGTRLNMEVEYTVPVKVLGKLAEPVIVKMNEREVETLLGNLKTQLEASTETAAG
jgi:carbon monoxide dehydrogenase subunit G